MNSRPAAAAVTTGWRLAGWALAWPLGAVVQLREAALQPMAVYAACVLVGMVLAGIAALGRRHWLIGALGLALLAFGGTGGRATLRLADALPVALEGRDVHITGIVASLPQRTAHGLRFRFEIEQATQGGAAVEVPALASLGWYAGTGFGEDAALTPQQLALRAGQRWQFSVRLRRPHALANPHGFDQELRWFEDGVRATGSVREPRGGQHAPTLIDSEAAYPVERLRQRVRDAIDASVPDARAAGVLAALAIGDQSAIERDDWELFRRSGVAHLVSISGLHVTMFAWLAGAAVGALWRRSARATLAVPAATAALWGGLVLACAYAVFSGWGVPAQRTVWMLAAVTLLRSAGLRWPWPLVLLAAATVVTAVDPWALLQPGFWLSFAAVGLLMLTGDGRSGGGLYAGVGGGDGDAAPSLWRRVAAVLRRVVAGGLRTQLIATVGLAPLTLVFFQQISLVGFVANLVAIPLVTLLITPLALLGTLFAPLWGAAAWLVSALSAWLGWLAAAPEAVWSVGVAPWWAQAAGLLGAAVLVMPLPWRVRALALPLVLPMLLPPRDLPAPGEFDLVAADVGQGTAVLVRTRHHLLVYDSGPQYSLESDAGQRVLLPLLRARGDHRIDTLVLSHRDSDHVGGAAALLSQVTVGALSSSIEDVHLLRLEARLRGVATQRCVAGQRWAWDGVQFEVLHPAAAAYDAALRSNAMSCVLKVQGRVQGTSQAREGGGSNASALLTGDIEREQEIRLLREQPEALRSAVLIVPHHGSKTSSIAAFLDRVAPTVAVFQAGHLNRYGHPADEVQARYRERGIALIDTPSCGAWTWRSSAPPLGRCHRTDTRRYWHWRSESPP